MKVGSVVGASTKTSSRVSTEMGDRSRVQVYVF